MSDKPEVIEVPAFVLEDKPALAEALGAMSRGAQIHPTLAQRALAYVAFVEQYNDVLAAGLSDLSTTFNILIQDKPETANEVLQEFQATMSSAFARVKDSFHRAEVDHQREDDETRG